MSTSDGLGAVKDRPISPAGVEHYLESEFDDNLGFTMRVMVKLTRSIPAKEVTACRLYGEFRQAGAGRLTSISSRGCPNRDEPPSVWWHPPMPCGPAC